MNLFRAAYARGRGKKTPLHRIIQSHISYNDETRHSYTLPIEDPKNV